MARSLLLSRFTGILHNNLLVGLLYLLCSTFIFGIWVWSADSPTTSFNGDPRSKLSELIYGTAHKPYVQRILVPIITRSIYGSIPASTWHELKQNLLQIPKVQKETKRLGWETEFLPEYIIALSLSFLTLVGFCYAIRYLWATFYTTKGEVTRLIPVIGLLGLPPIFSSGPHYIYDLPTLLLFTLGLALLLNRRWLLFYPVFIVGCLNKETMVFLSFVYIAVFFEERKTRHFFFHAIGQIAVFGVINIMLALQFAANAGNAMDFHLYLNLHLLLMGYEWSTLAIGALVLWLFMHDFQEKHPLLKRSILVAIPMGIIWLVSGVLVEVRALYELYPIFFILGLHTVVFSMFKIPFQINTAGTSTHV